MNANSFWIHLAYVTLVVALVGLSGCGKEQHVGAAATSDQERSVEAPNVDAIKDGWQNRVNYPKLPNSVCELWVKDGWLHARRLCSEEVVWQIVLAKVEAGVMPEVRQFEMSPAIHISYADGRYFIRDNSQVLRALRQEPSKQRPTFTAEDVFAESVEGLRDSGWAGGEIRYVTGKTDDKWFCATSGPSRDEMDCFVRLNRKELSEPNAIFGGSTGFSPMSDGLLATYYGASQICDDGELLTAHYIVPLLAQKRLNQKRIRENLGGGRPPEFDGTKWLNTEPLNWQDLRGKVVLVDFWATWCTPCVKKIPAVQELADKFADDGLVVIGVHSNNKGETCEAFAKKNKITFPLVVDSGKTQEQFGVESFPAYFLIDKSGKVVDGYLSAPPEDETIRAMLR